MIDVADAKKNEMAWRGIATKEGVDVQAKPDKLDKNINKAVEKIFRLSPEGKDLDAALAIKRYPRVTTDGRHAGPADD